MNNELYEEIVNEILKIVNIQWNKLIFYANYNDDSYQMNFYLKKNGSYIDSYTYISDENQLINIFNNINNIILKYEKKNPEWKIMTISVDNEGNFKTDFDYDNEYIHNCLKEWKNKYLI